MRATEFITEDDYYPQDTDYSRTEEELQHFMDNYVANELGEPHKASAKRNMDVIVSVPRNKNRKPGQRWDYEGQDVEWRETAADLIDELRRAEFGDYRLSHVTASYIELEKNSLNETTCAGGMATVVAPLGAPVQRAPKTKKKAKKTGKYANSKD